MAKRVPKRSSRVPATKPPAGAPRKKVSPFKKMGEAIIQVNEEALASLKDK